ncbi:hypothetical protein BYT27DRAFT_7216123 [Phlegmacium glaucopus]|nr:hypothetical protein BYT27DRAFT_7216123 [Phlegmacium glaucopus]
MPPIQHPQLLPSFNLALRADQYRTTLPNLSYPSRPVAHIPWSGSSAPLLFAAYSLRPQKTTRPEMTIATNVQVPTTANMCFDTCSVPDAFHGISMLIWDNLSIIVQKLKLIKEKLFGVRTTTGPSATATASV